MDASSRISLGLCSILLPGDCARLRGERQSGRKRKRIYAMPSPIEYRDASPDVRAVFDDIKRTRQVADVNNF
jgi:hypothetical protein